MRGLPFTLWPDTPLLMHIHSLLWFGLLIVLAYQLYRGVSGSAVVAGISILLFVSVQFSLSQPLLTDLILRIVEFRVTENMGKASK